MLDLTEIKNTIDELENGATTFDNCLKLASLYIVQNEHTKRQAETEPVEVELSDILPQYKTYCRIKRKYQLHEASEDAVQSAMKEVCKEIYEFVHTLYSSTDMQAERDSIKNLIISLKEAL